MRKEQITVNDEKILVSSDLVEKQDGVFGTNSPKYNCKYLEADSDGLYYHDSYDLETIEAQTLAKIEYNWSLAEIKSALIQYDYCLTESSRATESLSYWKAYLECLRDYTNKDDDVYSINDLSSSTYITDDATYSVNLNENGRPESLSVISSVPQVVSMRQARLALLKSEILTDVENAIKNGTDQELKIEWEYAIEIRRDWENLINLATSLGLTDDNLDDLFILAGTL